MLQAHGSEWRPRPSGGGGLVTPPVWPERSGTESQALPAATMDFSNCGQSRFLGNRSFCPVRPLGRPARSLYVGPGSPSSSPLWVPGRSASVTTLAGARV